MILDRFRETNWRPGPEELRKFAHLLLVGIPFSAMLWHVIVRLATGIWHWAVPLWILSLGVPISLLARVLPALARPLYIVWYALVCVIDVTVTTVTLTLAFYMMILPVGVAVRLARGGSMKRTPPPRDDSYWKPVEVVTDPRRHFRQF